jgi:hypothetical protein
VVNIQVVKRIKNAAFGSRGFSENHLAKTIRSAISLGRFLVEIPLLRLHSAASARDLLSTSKDTS